MSEIDTKAYEVSTVNWAEHYAYRLRSKPVLCRVKLRQTYRGQALKKAHPGIDAEIHEVFAIWLMDSEDPYAGEYALQRADGRRFGDDRTGLLWIASGDVEALQSSVSQN